MKRAAAFLLLALGAAACSRRAAANYRNCLTLRVGMTKEDLVKAMGEPDDVIPYVEGKSLDYLKGRTAYEWSNPAAMPGPDHVSVDDAKNRVESIRCANSEISAQVFPEAPAPSTAAAPAPAAPPQ
jgi:outer membrane protein assembly factor BamE (lipoprotein component of BamABCDE complex)